MTRHPTLSARPLVRRSRRALAAAALAAAALAALAPLAHPPLGGAPRLTTGATLTA